MFILPVGNHPVLLEYFTLPVPLFILYDTPYLLSTSFKLVILRSIVLVLPEGKVTVFVFIVSFPPVVVISIPYNKLLISIDVLLKLPVLNINVP